MEVVPQPTFMLLHYGKVTMSTTSAKGNRRPSREKSPQVLSSFSKHLQLRTKSVVYFTQRNQLLFPQWLSSVIPVVNIGEWL